MKVKFLFGYSGRETAMKTYDVDDTADIPTAAALELIRLGVVEEVEEEVIEPVVGELPDDIEFFKLPDFEPTIERVSKPRRRSKVNHDKNTQ